MIKVYVHNTEDWIATGGLVTMFTVVNGCPFSFVNKDDWIEIGEFGSVWD